MVSEGTMTEMMEENFRKFELRVGMKLRLPRNPQAQVSCEYQVFTRGPESKALITFSASRFLADMHE